MDLRNLGLNAAMTATFWVMAERYDVYRSARRLGNWLFRRDAEVQTPWDPDEQVVLIEGFRHSANSFLVGNVHPMDAHKVRSHSHRPWALRRAAEAGAPTVVMIRSPRDTTMSLCHRSMSADIMSYGVRFTPLFALLCWLGYYRTAWKYRDRLTFVEFADVERDPREVFDRVWRATGVRFLDETSYLTRHRFDGRRPDLPMSIPARLVLGLCERLHERIGEHARAGHAKTTPGAQPAAARADGALGGLSDAA